MQESSNASIPQADRGSLTVKAGTLAHSFPYSSLACSSLGVAGPVGACWLEYFWVAWAEVTMAAVPREDGEMVEVPKWAQGVLRPERIQLVEDAVKSAERETSGEIVPMIVRRSSTLGHVPVNLLSLWISLFMVLDGPVWQQELLGEH